MATVPANFDPQPEYVDRRAPLILGKAANFNELNEVVARPIEGPTSRGWLMALGTALMGLVILGGAVSYLVWEGTGIWGLNTPVAWGWAIVNFVFWVGIGHAGTLISAILFLFRQKWRTSINRAAEAMTIFAVVCALLFPTIHVGRIWLLYYVAPIPNQMDMWPQFRSPLLWDVFAVSIYGTVSILFWYVGLIPDFATMRDRAKGKIQQMAYGVVALGWRGSNRHWQHYERAYLLLAALATPLVLSVHSVVSFDFAVSQLPGWHTTIFPPYFVAGAIFSGFAMVITLLIIVRKIFKLESVMTIRHMENMAKVILLTGSLVGYAYAMEFFIAWYSGNPYELFAFVNRAFGQYSWAYWTMIFCNVAAPQLFWIRKFRTSIPVLFVISIIVNIGMWFERFVITVTSLHHDFLPSSWDYYSPSIWDILTFIGSFGLFFTLFLLFVRFIPMVAIAEVKAILPEADPHHHPDHSDHGDDGDDDHGDDDDSDDLVAAADDDSDDDGDDSDDSDDDGDDSDDDDDDSDDGDDGADEADDDLKREAESVTDAAATSAAAAAAGAVEAADAVAEDSVEAAEVVAEGSTEAAEVVVEDSAGAADAVVEDSAGAADAASEDSAGAADAASEGSTGAADAASEDSAEAASDAVSDAAKDADRAAEEAQRRSTEAAEAVKPAEVKPKIDFSFDNVSLGNLGGGGSGSGGSGDDENKDDD